MLNAFEYLEQTAARLPDKLAFADEKRGYSFSDLLSAAESVGTALLPYAARRSGEPPRCIAVLCDRTAISLVGMFGAMAAGCTYIPLDCRMPTDRLLAILNRVHPSAVLFAEHDRKASSALSDTTVCLCLEEIEAVPADRDALRLARERTLDIDPAYMIFTSGSTGMPKGILISHRALIDFTEWMGAFSGITEADVLGNQAPFTFDLSVKDIYQTLRSGATTWILPKKVFSFPLLLVDMLNEKGVTALIWATSAFRLTAESGVLEKRVPTTVKTVILGGESLQAKHLNLWKRAIPGLRCINLYGPTEVTVDCTAFPVTRDYADGEAIPIGHACRNMEVLLLDESLQVVEEPDVPGEICVRGIGLSLGYFGDPEKTAASFIQNPRNPNAPDRLYRTGDIAKWGRDGELYFLARRDDQIKHMGYRIELGEIETALNAVPGISAAVCFFDREADAIVCTIEATDVLTDRDPAALMMLVKDRLPKYMLPNVWQVTDRLPLNPNGKIDRRALREQYEAAHPHS